jgi:hypothetical protein
VTTGGFTEMAAEAARGKHRIEPIDGGRLVENYKMAYGKITPEQVRTEQVRTEKIR